MELTRDFEKEVLDEATMANSVNNTEADNILRGNITEVVGKMEPVEGQEEGLKIKFKKMEKMIYNSDAQWR